MVLDRVADGEEILRVDLDLATEKRERVTEALQRDEAGDVAVQNARVLGRAGGGGLVLRRGGLIADRDSFGALSQLFTTHPSTEERIARLLQLEGGDATPERYRKVVEVCAKDPNMQGLLVLLTPQAMTDPTETARQLVPFAHLQHKPVLASWMGHLMDSTSTT